jgi:hypothetical protein
MRVLCCPDFVDRLDLPMKSIGFPNRCPFFLGARMRILRPFGWETDTQVLEKTLE